MRKMLCQLFLIATLVPCYAVFSFAGTCEDDRQLVDKTISSPPKDNTESQLKSAFEMCPNDPKLYQSVGDYYLHWSKNDISPEKQAFYSYLATEHYADGIKSGKGDAVKAMKFKLAALESGAEDITEVGIRSIKPFARLNVRVFFQFNSAELTPGAQEQLDVLGQYLSEKKASHIIIEGHTDMAGPEGYNKELSIQRAKSAKNYIVEKYGLASDAIETHGYGFERLANVVDPYNSKNRRVRVRKLAD